VQTTGFTVSLLYFVKHMLIIYSHFVFLIKSGSYTLNIINGQMEKDEEKVARYINGLRYEIRDEINKMAVRTVEDSYQFALKAEEKLARKQSQQGRGKIRSHTKSHGCRNWLEIGAGDHCTSEAIQSLMVAERTPGNGY
jgi:hypothetical protein